MLNRIPVGVFVLMTFLAIAFAVFFLVEIKADPTQQYNKIYLTPFYRASMTNNNNYNYSIYINPPDGMSSIQSAIISFDVYLNPSVNFTLSVNDKPCNTYYYYISTTYASAGQSRVTFDCSNLINKKGTYIITLRPSGANTGSVTGWVDLTYINNPKGEITKVGGTEYDIADDFGKIFLQIVDNQKQPISNSSCFSTIFYPNTTTMISNNLMTYLQDGIHYVDISIPKVTGVYIMSAYCTVPSSTNITIWDDFECNGLNCGSGWLSDWSTSGDCQVRSDGSPMDDYHMRCSYTLALGSGNATRRINTTGCTIGYLSFWAKATGLEAGDYCTYQYWNGTGTNTLLSITTPNDDNVYRYYTYEVCSTYGTSSNSGIYFNSTNNVLGDYCWIDNVNFTNVYSINLTQYEILRGSGELHITDHVNKTVSEVWDYPTRNLTFINFSEVLYRMDLANNTIITEIHSVNQSIFSKLYLIQGDLAQIYATVGIINTTITDIDYWVNQNNAILLNLSLGNVSVYASLNWTMLQEKVWDKSSEAKIKSDLLSFADDEIHLVMTDQYCINSTLMHVINETRCLLGTCYYTNSTNPENCIYGCDNHQCKLDPTWVYGILMLVIIAVGVGIYAINRFVRF